MPDTSVNPQHLTKTRDILEINHGRCTQGDLNVTGEEVVDKAVSAALLPPYCCCQWWLTL